MKKINIIIAIAAMVCVSTTTFAQQKFAHIEFVALLELMPEKAQAQAELEKVAAPLNETLEAMMGEYQSKMEEFQAQAENMAKSVQELKAKELTDLENRIKEFQESAQTELTMKEQEIIEPLYKKAQNAVDAVAQEKGYSYVLDSSSGVLIFKKDSDDIMADVKGQARSVNRFIKNCNGGSFIGSCPLFLCHGQSANRRV